MGNDEIAKQPSNTMQPALSKKQGKQECFGIMLFTYNKAISLLQGYIGNGTKVTKEIMNLLFLNFMG